MHNMLFCVVSLLVLFLTSDAHCTLDFSLGNHNRYITDMNRKQDESMGSTRNSGQRSSGRHPFWFSLCVHTFWFRLRLRTVQNTPSHEIQRRHRIFDRAMTSCATCLDRSTKVFFSPTTIISNRECKVENVTRPVVYVQVSESSAIWRSGMVREHCDSVHTPLVYHPQSLQVIIESMSNDDRV